MFANAESWLVGFLGFFYLLYYRRINAYDFNLQREPIPSRLGDFRWLYKLIIISTFLVVFLSGTKFKPFLFVFNIPFFFKAISPIIIILSLGYFILSVRTVGSEYSPCYDLYEPIKLITTGVYKRIRHPIYAANLYLLFGLFLMESSVFIVINWILLFIFYYNSALLEEGNLEMAFPEYKDYKLKTRMFFPFF